MKVVIEESAYKTDKQTPDVTFENLFQELIDLASSCTNIERVKSVTELTVFPNKIAQNEQDESKSCKVVNSPSESNQLVDAPSLLEPPAIPPRTKSSYEALGRLKRSDNSQKLLTTSPTNRPVLVPANKSIALTIDVGLNGGNKLHNVTVPVQGSLITVTSPQVFTFDTSVSRTPARTCPLPICDKRSPNKQQTMRKSLVGNDAFPGANVVGVDNSKQPSSIRGLGAMAGDKLSKVDREDSFCKVNGTYANDVRDHVAEAIVTGNINVAESTLQAPARKVHRSYSEPSTFVTLIPEKRLQLVKNSTKRDSKNKNLLKVGMDFIRRANTANDEDRILQLSKQSSLPQSSPKKDNFIVNNLNHQNSFKNRTTTKDKMVIHVKPSLTSVSQSKTISLTDSVFESETTPTQHVPTTQQNEKGIERQHRYLQNVQTSSMMSSNQSGSQGSTLDSEELDILASLKSSNALKNHRYGKFPTDVDPITGSPRQHLVNNCDTHTSDDASMVMHLKQPQSSSASKASSPLPSTCSASYFHPAQRSPQNPISLRCRHSYYDNLGPASPHAAGTRMSMESASSSGTVFSRPWGDLSKWEELFHHQHQVYYNREDISRYKESLSVCQQVPPEHDQVAFSQVISQQLFTQRHREKIIPKQVRPVNEPIPSLLKDLAQIREVTSNAENLAAPAEVHHSRNTWEHAIDRAINCVRMYTKLLTADNRACEITRYVNQLIASTNSLPGVLVAQFLTCTWESPSAAAQGLFELHREDNSTVEKDKTTPKTDWYSSNTQPLWSSDAPFSKQNLLYTGCVYANDGYGTNTNSRDRNGLSCHSSSKEHKTLSNVRQFMDGMKRYLMNEPDAQMMYAIQRERRKRIHQLGSDQLINLDAVMESILEKVILSELSDHLLNVITSHPDYSIRLLSKVSNGMKLVAQHKYELFSHMLPALSTIDCYEQTIRSAFQSLKSEFSPLAKLQYLLQIGLVLLLVHSKMISSKPHDLTFVFLYALACYSDSTLIVHLAYTRHLIPQALQSPAIFYIFSLYETCGIVYEKLAKVLSFFNQRKMMLCDIMSKLSCQVIFADESSNQLSRKTLTFSKWCTALELIEILNVETGNNDSRSYKLYLVADDREVLLKPKENLSSQIRSLLHTDVQPILVYRKSNTQLLLPQNVEPL